MAVGILSFGLWGKTCLQHPCKDSLWSNYKLAVIQFICYALSIFFKNSFLFFFISLVTGFLYVIIFYSFQINLESIQEWKRAGALNSVRCGFKSRSNIYQLFLFKQFIMLHFSAKPGQGIMGFINNWMKWLKVSSIVSGFLRGIQWSWPHHEERKDFNILAHMLSTLYLNAPPLVTDQILFNKLISFLKKHVWGYLWSNISNNKISAFFSSYCKTPTPLLIVIFLYLILKLLNALI